MAGERRQVERLQRLPDADLFLRHWSYDELFPSQLHSRSRDVFLHLRLARQIGMLLQTGGEPRPSALRPLTSGDIG
jgi:hypothetical protein